MGQFLSLIQLSWHEPLFGFTNKESILKLTRVVSFNWLSEVKWKRAKYSEVKNNGIKNISVLYRLSSLD